MPSSLRLMWAEELERWIPNLLPSALSVLFHTADKARGRTAPRLASALCLQRVAPNCAQCTRDLRSGGLAPSRLSLPKTLLDDLPLREPGAASASAAAPAAASAAASPVPPISFESPRAVVASFRMAEILKSELRAVRWGAVVVDESHVLRACWKRVRVQSDPPGLSRASAPLRACFAPTHAFTSLPLPRPRAPQESLQTEAVVALARECPRAVLMSGTPSLNRPFDLFCQADALWPGLLGETKHRFAESYCELRQGIRGREAGRGTWRSCSGGVRLRELHLLLREAGLVRRLKRDVAEELPPLRRQARPRGRAGGPERSPAHRACVRVAG